MKTKIKKINLFKRLFNKKDKNFVKKISVVKKDEKGFCDVYISGEKANFRVLVLDKD